MQNRFQVVLFCRIEFVPFIEQCAHETICYADTSLNILIRGTTCVVRHHSKSKQVTHKQATSLPATNKRSVCITNSFHYMRCLINGTTNVTAEYGQPGISSAHGTPMYYEPHLGSDLLSPFIVSTDLTQTGTLESPLCPGAALSVTTRSVQRRLTCPSRRGGWCVLYRCGQHPARFGTRAGRLQGR